jgi:N utilization substance protein B
MKKTGRSKARELVLQGLYAIETGETSPEKILEDVIKSDDLDAKAVEFATRLFEQVRNQKEWANKSISDLAHNWRLERIAVIDQIILRMAMTELNGMPDTPVKVVLNEAIELAKLYSTGESSGFINGILDTFVKNLPEANQV